VIQKQFLIDSPRVSGIGRPFRSLGNRRFQSGQRIFVRRSRGPYVGRANECGFKLTARRMNEHGGTSQWVLISWEKHR
jgi:hypothetical protein